MNQKDILAQMFSLGGFDDIQIDKKETIEHRKRLGKLLEKSRKEAKLMNCYYCGDECSSFCNSHSIPVFLIKNISNDGKVYNNNEIIELPLIDSEIGVNKTGTFQLICRKCDSKIFSDYENPENYKSKPTTKMIAQIAMKNYLKSISKRKLEIPLYDFIKSDLSMPSHTHEARQTNNDLDLNEYINDFKRAKRVVEKGWSDEYYLFYYRKLDYVVPLVFQSNVTLIVDLEGNIVNQVYNTSSSYVLQSLHICVFPLEGSSVLMMFIDSKNKRYRSFYKQFSKLSDEDKLKAINFIIFSLSEDVYISKSIDKIVIKDEKFREVCTKTLDIVSLMPVQAPYELAKKNFDFKQMHEIPNLLSRRYKL